MIIVVGHERAIQDYVRSVDLLDPRRIRHIHSERDLMGLPAEGLVIVYVHGYQETITHAMSDWIIRLLRLGAIEVYWPEDDH